MAHHGSSLPPTGAPDPNGDDFRWPLYHRCPDACDRLNVFQWEWMADRDPEARDWNRRMRKPLSQDRGVNEDGLLDACVDVAAVVQQELHALPSPLEGLQAIELWHLRHGYLNALVYLGGNRLAKEVEAEVAPNAQPLAICLGSEPRPERIQTVRGLVTMRGYHGCYRTFPDLPFGPGRRWPRLCPECEPRRTNDRKRATRELQRRVALSMANCSGRPS